MTNIYNNRPLIPIGKPALPDNKAIEKKSDTSNSFVNVLEQEITKQTEVKFSKHALDRLQSRNIKLTKEDLNKINNAVNKAAEKGVKESLIIMGDTAFIANIKNKTIITATTEETLKNNVFTNIDGAVII